MAECYYFLICRCKRFLRISPARSCLDRCVCIICFPEPIFGEMLKELPFRRALLFKWQKNFHTELCSDSYESVVIPSILREASSDSKHHHFKALLSHWSKRKSYVAKTVGGRRMWTDNISVCHFWLYNIHSVWCRSVMFRNHFTSESSSTNDMVKFHSENSHQCFMMLSLQA